MRVDNPEWKKIHDVIWRWYSLGMIHFSTRDDGSDDLILADEIYKELFADLKYVTNDAGVEVLR
jgi:hypothetical protein